MSKLLKKQAGFTLLELLIVIVAAVILVVVIISVNNWYDWNPIVQKNPLAHVSGFFIRGRLINMSVDVIVGLQRGDEGKGRFVDMLSEKHDIVTRFNGGNNAGHTVVLPDGRDLALHLVPSGIAHPGIMNIIGNGTLVNPIKLVEEIDDIKSKGIESQQQEFNAQLGCSLDFTPPYLWWWNQGSGQRAPG